MFEKISDACFRLCRLLFYTLMIALPGCGASCNDFLAYVPPSINPPGPATTDVSVVFQNSSTHAINLDTLRWGSNSNPAAPALQPGSFSPSTVPDKHFMTNGSTVN